MELNACANDHWLYKEMRGSVYLQTVPPSFPIGSNCRKYRPTLPALASKNGFTVGKTFNTPFIASISFQGPISFVILPGH